MSIAGRNRFRGDTCQVKRATTAAGTGGEQTRTWSVVVAATQIEIHTLTDARAREIYGSERVIDAIAVVDNALDVAELDGLIVSAGLFAGERFMVTGIRRFDGLRELALERTTEAF